LGGGDHLLGQHPAEPRSGAWRAYFSNTGLFVVPQYAAVPA
jgi:hypothetical protein